MNARSSTWLAIAAGGALALVGCGGSTCTSAASASTTAATLREPTAAPETLHVEIGGLVDGQVAAESVFAGFGCEGGNRSLALSWSGAPEGTQSYAVVVHDPDAPTGVGFFHWVALDLPASTSSLPLGASGSAMPAGAVEAYTDFGANGYGGPCPPPGAPHRYEVTVYALDVPSVGLPPGATGALARFVLRGHTLALGRAVATYGR